MNWALPIAAVGGGVADAIAGSAARRAQSGYVNKALQQYRRLRGWATTAGDQALGERQKAIGSVRGGFNQALATTANAGRAGETAARDTAQQAFGGASQDLINRGIYDPEHLNYARMGISSSLARALQYNAERTAQARSSLLVGRGQAVGAAQGDVASQYLQNYGLQAGISDQIAQIFAGQAAGVQQPSYGEDIGWLVQGLGRSGGGGGAPAAPAQRYSYPTNPYGSGMDS